MYVYILYVRMLGVPLFVILLMTTDKHAKIGIEVMFYRRCSMFPLLRAATSNKPCCSRSAAAARAMMDNKVKVCIFVYAA